MPDLNTTEFKTRAIDNTKLVSVRLDERTVMQVKRGSDIKRLKKKYLQRLHDSKVEATHYKHLRK